MDQHLSLFGSDNVLGRGVGLYAGESLEVRPESLLAAGTVGFAETFKTVY